MFEKIRKMKNKKGFTLVELIVVLVILAILAALLVPALTGYIDKANQEKVIATTRQVVMAAQAEASEAYGKVATGTFTAITPLTDSTKPSLDTVLKLAEVKDDKGMRNGVEASVVINVDGDLPFQNLGVRVLPGIRKIIFCTHNHKTSLSIEFTFRFG